MVSSLLVSILLVFAESVSAAFMTNSWAVEIHDTRKEEVDLLAKKHGFINLGLVLLLGYINNV